MLLVLKPGAEGKCLERPPWSESDGKNITVELVPMTMTIIRIQRKTIVLFIINQKITVGLKEKR